MSRSSLHKSIYDRVIDTPNLHMIGESDQIIPKAVSQQLLECFMDPTVIYHPSGHLVPSSANIKSSLLGFLNQFSW